MRVTNRSEAGDASKYTRESNRYLADKRDKKKTARARGSGLLAILFVRSPLPAGIGIEGYNRSYLSVRRNVLRWRLSYESALNASSNEINMPNGSFRVIYEHGRDTENLRGFVTNFSTPESSREITIALTSIKALAKADNARRINVIDSIFYEDRADRFSIYPLIR